MAMVISHPKGTCIIEGTLPESLMNHATSPSSTAFGVTWTSYASLPLNRRLRNDAVLVAALSVAEIIIIQEGEVFDAEEGGRSGRLQPILLRLLAQISLLVPFSSAVYLSRCLRVDAYVTSV